MIFDDILFSLWLTFRAVAIATVGLCVLACISNFIWAHVDAYHLRRHAEALFHDRYRGRSEVPDGRVISDRNHPLYSLGGGHGADHGLTRRFR